MNSQTQTPEAAVSPADHRIVSREEWISARKELLEKEKAFTRMKDKLSAERRALPWVKVDKNYTFTGPNGPETLADLFDGRSQLIVYHFMFGPGWKEGCPGCSFLSDHIDGANQHLPHADLTLLAVSRAPLPEIEAFKKRMGWHFKWVSSHGSDFNFDYHVSFTEEDLARGKVFYNYELKDGIDELPGASVFYKNVAGEVFHTYSAFARGCEQLIGAFNFLDMAPLGRNEKNLDDGPMEWVRHHDRYDEVAGTESHAAQESDDCCNSKKA